MNPSMFRAKWEKTDLTERSAAHEHFLDLCALFDHPTPADADPEGEWFTFEKGAEKLGGGDGWADVWKREFFAWEYKGKHKNLEAAYNQLLQYRESLENPPLLVVCDMDRIVIRTNFTNTRVQKYTIPLSTLDTTEHLDILRAVFHDPEMLKPGAIRETITTRVASRIAELAQILRDRGLDAHRVARFLDRIVFCMFAEDIGLLPKQTSARIAENSKGDSEAFSEMLKDLFEKMAHGGYFGSDAIRHFNGNLFSDAEVLELRMEEIAQVQRASHLDWGAVDPSVFGTLFERGLDPSKRSQLGAHYTSRQDIETLVEPVVMQPLRREWEAVCEQVEALLEKIESRSKPAPRKASDQAGILLRPGRQEGFEHVNKLLHDFLGRLGGVKVLDPACGSGNFLYVTLQKLMDLEKEVNDYALSRELVDREPKVGPWQLYGIELNPYAYDLAQTTIWIGYLQWMHDHGYAIRESPVLRSMDNFRCMDAIIDLSDPANPKEPEWPEADFIVGNPPFLGGNRVRQELGDEYLDALFKLYQERVPAFADLCCYWFERARTEVARHRCNRAGLLATQGIRGGANREVLKRIKESGDIFFAESDRPWILEGANVHVSMIGFDEGVEPTRTLDGKAVTAINPDLTAKADISRAARLPDNASISFMGPSPKAPFDIDEDMALRFLVGTANVHGRPNSDVVRPVCSAVDMVSQPRRMWTIDFFQLPQEEAARYEAPFAHLKRAAQAIRTANRRKPYAEKWWLYAEPRPGLRAAAAGLARFLVTPVWPNIGSSSGAVPRHCAIRAPWSLPARMTISSACFTRGCTRYGRSSWVRGLRPGRATPPRPASRHSPSPSRLPSSRRRSARRRRNSMSFARTG